MSFTNYGKKLIGSYFRLEVKWEKIDKREKNSKKKHFY